MLRRLMKDSRLRMPEPRRLWTHLYGALCRHRTPCYRVVERAWHPRRLGVPVRRLACARTNGIPMFTAWLDRTGDSPTLSPPTRSRCPRCRQNGRSVLVLLAARLIGLPPYGAGRSTRSSTDRCGPVPLYSNHPLLSVTYTQVGGRNLIVEAFGPEYPQTAHYDRRADDFANTRSAT
jgi:hypothetical protein